jgi:hypothetical protein
MRGRRGLLLVAGLAALLVAAVLAAALYAALESRSDARVAESRALAGASIALSPERPETALLLAVEAIRLVDDGSPSEGYEARNALVLGWQRFARVQAIMRGHG